MRATQHDKIGVGRTAFWLVIEYVQGMQTKIQSVLPIVCQHMEKAQTEHHMVSFRPATEFLVCWQSLFIITEHVRELNFRLQQLGK